MSVLALIPARSGSKGIPGKNFRQLGGKPLWRIALNCAEAAGCDRLLVSSGWDTEFWNMPDPAGRYGIIRRSAELCSDTAPMIAVVQHALAQLPGQPDDIIVLLQPTQPLRKPEHVQQAITLLRESGADSVVSVVPVPLTAHPLWQCVFDESGRLTPWPGKGDVEGYWFNRPTRRQELTQTYRPDGTVYVTTREAIERCNSLFGSTCVPLIIDPADTCELDTESDWASLQARWKERHD